LSDTGSGFGAGSIWRTRSEGFSYEEAPTSATDQHVTTAGGVKLYALPIGNFSHSILQFGASTSATPAENRAAITKALEVAADLIVPPGVFVIEKTGDGSFSLGPQKDNATLRGSGWDCCIKLENATNNDDITRMIAPGNYGVIRDLCIDGGRGEFFQQFNRFGGAIYGGSSRRGYKIINCHVKDTMADGLYSNLNLDPDDPLDRSDIVVDRCFFERCGRQGVAFVRFDTIYVTNSVFVDASVNFEAQAAFGDKAINVFLSNLNCFVTADYWNPRAINLQGGIASQPSGNFKFSNINCFGGSVKINGSSSDLSNENDFHGSVDGLTILGSVSSPALQIDLGSNGLTINKLRIKGAGGNGIEIARGRNIRISDFYISDCTSRGIRMASPGSTTTDQLSISDGTIENCATGFDPQPYGSTQHENSSLRIRDVDINNCATPISPGRIEGATINGRVQSQGLRVDGAYIAAFRNSFMRVGDPVANSTATDVAGIVAAHNALLEKLREARIILT
jgi:hypothetical protein